MRKEIRRCKKDLKEIRKYRKGIEKRIKEAREMHIFMQESVAWMKNEVQNSTEFLETAAGWLLNALREEGEAEQVLVGLLEGVG